MESSVRMAPWITIWARCWRPRIATMQAISSTPDRVAMTGKDGDPLPLHGREVPTFGGCAGDWEKMDSSTPFQHFFATHVLWHVTRHKPMPMYWAHFSCHHLFVLNASAFSLRVETLRKYAMMDTFDDAGSQILRPWQPPHRPDFGLRGTSDCEPYLWSWAFEC